MRLDNSGVETEGRTRRHAGPVGAGRVRLSVVDIDLFDHTDAADEHGGGEVQQARRGAAVVGRTGRPDGRKNSRHRGHRAHDRRRRGSAPVSPRCCGCQACSAAAGSVDLSGLINDPDLSRVVHRLFRTRLSVLRRVAVRHRFAREQPEGSADADDADPAAADRAAARDGADRSRPERPARAGVVVASAVHAVRDDEPRGVSAGDWSPTSAPRC